MTASSNSNRRDSTTRDVFVGFAVIFAIGAAVGVFGLGMKAPAAIAHLIMQWLAG